MDNGNRTYTVPAVVTVSRKTGKITGIEYAQTDESHFHEFCRWLLEMNGMAELARNIPKKRATGKQIST